MLFRRQKISTILCSPRFSAHLTLSKVRQWVSQPHLLPNKKFEWQIFNCFSSRTQYLIWFYRCWATQNTIKTKNVIGALWLRMPKGLQCYFTSFCNVSFSSFLMSECQNIELDELLFIFYHVLYIELVFIFPFNCQYVYNAERSLPSPQQWKSYLKTKIKADV